MGVVVSQLGRGGAERQTALLLEGLREHPWRPRVVVCLSDDTEPYGRVIRDAGYPLVTLRRGRNFDPVRVFDLRSQLRRHGLDLVHAVHLLASAYSYLAALGLSGPRVLPTVRGTVVEPGPLRAWVYRRMFRSAPVSLVNSERGSRFVQTRFGAPESRLAVVRNGVDFEALRRVGVPSGLRQCLGVPADARVLCYVGKNSRVKNIGRLGRVWREVARRDPRAHLVLVGGGLSEIPSDFGGDVPADRTHALGPRDDVPSILSESDVVVLTSDSEGAPNVVLEALALGTPVVSTDVGDVSEMVCHNRTGWLAPCENESLLVQGVAHVLTDPTRFRNSVLADQDRLERLYSLHSMIDGTLDCWRRCLGT